MSRSIKEWGGTVQAGNVLSPLSKGFGDVLKSIKIGMKDIWGSLKYAFQITFAFDEAKIQNIKKKRRDSLNKIAREYSSLWKDVVSTNEDISVIAMLAAPGPYFAAYSVLNSREKVAGAQEFLKDVGVSSRWLEKIFGNPIEGEESQNYVRAMMLRRDTAGAQSTAIESELREIARRLSAILRVNNPTESNSTAGRLIEEADASSEKENKLSTIDILSRSKKMETASRDLISNKKQQLLEIKESITILEKNEEELGESINNASTTEAIVSAIKKFSDLLSGSDVIPITIKFEEDSFNKSIKKNFEFIKKNNPKAVSGKDANLEIAKSIAARLLSSENYLSQKKQMVSSLVEIWMDGIPQELFKEMEKISPDDEYVKTLSMGLKELTGEKSKE